MLTFLEWKNTTGIPRASAHNDIEAYTGKFGQSSGMLNHHLKLKGAGQESSLKKWNNKSPDEAAENISKSLKPTTQDKELYTGIGHNPSKFWEEGKHNTSNPVTIHHHAFISTSHLPLYTSSFSADKETEGSHDYKKHPLRNPKSVGAKAEGSINHILKISVPKGTKASRISHLSRYPDENETLLDKGLKLEIHPHPEAKIFDAGRGRMHDKLKTFIWHAKVVE